MNAPGRRHALGALLAIAAAPAHAAEAASAPTTVDSARRAVEAAERAFARSMAERDHPAFVRHLSEQAVFFGERRVLRGRDAVAAGWKPFFEAAQAPFSWEPDQIEVTADGQLAHSSGPVRDPEGRPIARFNSVWRLEAPGTWRIVFDRGSPWAEPAR
jgi:ketosteroid isomerase-like protein